MGAAEQRTVFYAPRAMAALRACLGVSLLGFSAVVYLVHTPGGAVNSWAYYGPVATGIAILVGAVIFVGTLSALYWAVTPLPVLQVDSVGLVYRPYPFVRGSLRWANVDGLSTIHPRSLGAWLLGRWALDLHVRLKPEAVGAYRNHEVIIVRLNRQLLPSELNAVVRSIRHYHPIEHETAM